MVNDGRQTDSKILWLSSVKSQTILEETVYDDKISDLMLVQFVLMLILSGLACRRGTAVSVL